MFNQCYSGLVTGLREDIARCVSAGDFERARRLISLRLGENITDGERGCLTAYREIIEALPASYPHTYDEAFLRIREAVPDFTKPEFDALIDRGHVDWIYIHGEMRFIRSVAFNAYKSDDGIAARTLPGLFYGGDYSPYDRCMLDMASSGGAAARVRVRHTLRIKEGCLDPAQTLRVWLPIPAECARQSDITIESTCGKKAYIARGDAGQRTAFFEDTPGGDGIFSVEYSFTTRSRFTDTTKPLIRHEAAPAGSLDEKPPHIVFTPYIRELALKLTEGIDAPIEKARAIFDYLTLNMRYAYPRSYRAMENIAEQGIRMMRGDCGVMSVVFISMLRSIGIPALWQGGAIVRPDMIGSHDWAVFYAEPYGLLYADVSFAIDARDQQNEARRRFYFGNTDVYRMVFNNDFYCEFDPPCLHRRGDPYDNQTGEIEYASRPIDRADVAGKKELISFTPLEYR